MTERVVRLTGFTITDRSMRNCALEDAIIAVLRAVGNKLLTGHEIDQ